MPSGPAFADEAEFEKELSESFTARASLAAAPLEDEFDFDGSPSSPSHTSSPAVTGAAAAPVSAIKRALETAAERAEREAQAEAAAAIAEQQREVVSLTEKNKAAEAATAGLLGDGGVQGEIHLKSGSSGSLAKSEADKKSRIMEAAKQALDDVMNVYGSGLGDHSIRVMEATDALAALPESSIGVCVCLYISVHFPSVCTFSVSLVSACMCVYLYTQVWVWLYVYMYKFGYMSGCTYVRIRLCILMCGPGCTY